MVGRLWWTLARDNATPFAGFFGRVNIKLSCPVESTIFCAIICTAFGAIQLGSKTAFTDLVGSFIILTTTSYFLAFFPHLLTGRKNVPPGPFWLGRWGFLVNSIACTLIVFFNIFFCFPYAYPVSPISVMNCKFPHGSNHLHITSSTWPIAPFFRSKVCADYFTFAFRELRHPCRLCRFDCGMVAGAWDSQISWTKVDRAVY